MKYLTCIFIMLVIGCDGVKNNMLPNTPEVLSALETLKMEKKFTEDVVDFYPGAPTKIIRSEAEMAINSALSSLIAKSKSGLSNKELWIILERSAKSLSRMDSEELERGLSYMEQIMDIYSIESSDGRLNKWRYGFDPQ